MARRGRILLGVLAAILIVWLLILSGFTIRGCGVDRAIVPAQEMALQAEQSNQQLKARIDSLQTDLAKANKQLQEVYGEVEKLHESQKSTTTDINVKLRGDWTPAEQAQLERILKNAINNP